VVVPVKAGTQEFRQDSGFRLFAAWSLSSGRPKAGPGGPERREQLCDQRPFILVCMPRGRATCVRPFSEDECPSARPSRSFDVRGGGISRAARESKLQQLPSISLRMDETDEQCPEENAQVEQK